MASSSASFKHHVFLSFRGEDTRYTFTDHLYNALRAKGIETFMDDQLTRGEFITPALVTAIKGSRHSVIVLSENYASSKWCLDELVKILQTQNTKGRRAVPIFYNVNPSDVGNQRGSFGTALADHEEKLKYDMERVEGWRKALTQVGKISGFTYSRDRPETQFIEEIVIDISKDLNCVSSSDGKNLVGMDRCIREVESLLCLESTEVRMVGIWGMGGIGKTTLARVVYERLLTQFEGCCFLEDLKRKSINKLKKELLSQVLGDKNISKGHTSIKARLHSKKVLIVIDDVNHQSFLETLVGECDGFGPQSRIIITTRNKHLLTMQGVEENAIYEVKNLGYDDAIELFSRYAFKNKSPTKDVMNILCHIISYAQGLPLALKVLGCFLWDRNEDCWTDMLNQLKKIPNGEIQKVLQISFDGLENNEKEIFLDIACFFRGSDKTLVEKILKSCGFFVAIGVNNLIDKSLITVTDDGKLEMHDLLQEMGWQIVHNTSPKDPGKRSRLWKQKDISHILKRETGDKEVEGIFLNLSGLKEIKFTTKAFSGMIKLRLLKIYRSNLGDTGGKMQCELHISNDFKFHYDELRYLHWEEYPGKSLPSDFESENLACFCMPHSHLTQLWEGQKVFGNLKFVDVSYSQHLKKTPDFSEATNLEELVLKGCTSLLEIHSSLGYLSQLILLNLENCINLEHLPSIRRLVSLESLILCGCSKLKKLPEVPQHMPHLSELSLHGTAITDFSGWLELGNFQENSGNLDCLGALNSDDSAIRPPSSSVVQRNHNASLSSVPRSSSFISPCPSLTHLNLSGTPIIHLPWNLERLSNLRRLQLRDCRSLQALPVLPSSLERLDSNNCRSLELISPQSLFKPFGFFLFGNCFKLSSEYYQSKMEHDVQSVASHFDPGRWRSHYDRGHPHVMVMFNLIFPGREIPDWFRHHSQGHEINIEVPPDWYINSNFLGFALSVVLAPPPRDYDWSWNIYCDLDTHDLNFNSHRICSFVGCATDHFLHAQPQSYHVWLTYVPSFFNFNCEKWSHIKFSFSSNIDGVMKSCGVCPVYIKGTSDEGDYSNGSAQRILITTSGTRRGEGQGGASGSLLLDEGETENFDNFYQLLEGEPSGSLLFEDEEKIALQDLIRRGILEEGEPSGSRWSSNDSENSHHYGIQVEGEASVSVGLFEDEDKTKLQDTITRRSLDECEPTGSGCSDYNDSHSYHGLVSGERRDLQITTNLPQNPTFSCVYWFSCWEWLWKY